MRNGTLASALLLGVVLSSPAPAQPIAGLETPVEIVRSVGDLQDGIALGRSSDVASTRAFLATAAQKLSAQQADVWREPRNARAALIFCMSGGSPQILRTILGYGPLPGIDEAIVKGVLAFAEGRDEDARGALADVDARDLDPAIAANVALVQGIVFAEKDGAKAKRFFDRARLLAPESSIEEAALRREVPMLAAKGELEASYMLASRYLRRYSKSAYAGSFTKQFSNDVARLSEAATERSRSMLAGILENVAVPDRRKIYLALARQSVVKGNIDMARFAAERAAQLSTVGSPDSIRSKVYEAAALVVTDDYAEAVETLGTVDRARLPKRDAELVDAAASVASEVRRWPETAGAQTETPDATPQHDKDKATMELVERARRLMTKVDLMNGAAK
jgi:chemotaxis protein MotC